LAVWDVIAWWGLITTVIRYYSALPFWDYWDTVAALQAFFRHDLVGALWIQHNDHRLFFPSTIFLADYLFFAGRQILPLLLSIAAYLALWLLLARALVLKAGYQFQSIAACLIVGGIAACEAAALVITSPFLVQWTLTLASAVVALFLFGGVPDSRRSWTLLVLAIASAVVASYSAANGLFLWPILVLGAWLLRLPTSQKAVVVLSGIAFSAFFFVGYHFTREAKPGVMLQHPIYTLCFIFAYLGAPFTVVRPWLGVFVGCACFLLVAALSIGAAKQGKLRTRTAFVLFGTYALVLLTAPMTAVSRLDPADWNLGGADAQRYILMPLIADGCMLLLLAWLIGSRYTRVWSALTALFTVGFLLVGRSQGVDVWNGVVRQYFVNTQYVAVAMRSGLFDTQLNKLIWASVPEVARRARVLRDHRLSIFAAPDAQWLGKQMSSVVPFISSIPEPGAIAEVTPVESGVVVTAWTDTPRRIVRAERFIFVDQMGKIVGFGSKLSGGLPLDRNTLNVPRSLALVGFINLQPGSESFNTYSVTQHGTAFRMGESIPRPLIRPTTSASAGPALASVAWHGDGWVKNGPFPVTPVDMPTGIEYYESWAGSDANTGTLESNIFEAPADHCLVISAANGPTNYELSVALMDADKNSVLASLPLNGWDLSWRYWMLDIPASVKHLQIVAKDGGKGWGEWLAIGQPQSYSK
jgi:hypothetical protein